jgi:hypothetical protein
MVPPMGLGLLLELNGAVGHGVFHTARAQNDLARPRSAGGIGASLDALDLAAYASCQSCRSNRCIT